MGLPMRYPRFFTILFVALVIAAPPAADASAPDADLLTDTPWQIETTPEISQRASSDTDPARRGAVVDLLVRRTDLDHDEAGRLLDAVTGLVVAVAGAGERAGVLASPEIDVLLDAVLDIAGSLDPQSGRESENVDLLTERPMAAGELLIEADGTARDGLLSTEAAPVADRVEQWRPLVERYFPPERIEEALSIIDCESNGDPNASNPRSSASGLFQFLDRTWSHSSEQAGFQGESPLSPEANIAAAAWLVEYSLDVGDSPWAHWTCRP